MPSIINLSQNISIISQFIAEIRDKEIQKDRLRFRRNIERFGEIAAYEISKTLPYRKVKVQTPLAETECSILSEQPLIACILRASLPLHSGLLNYFDKADSSFISAFRKYSDPENFEIELRYVSSPALDKRILILADPMLASGKSLTKTFQALLERGTPKTIHILSLIASQAGLDMLSANVPADTRIWVGAVDPDLNSHAYIVPGIGDAGDLAFGEKL